MKKLDIENYIIKNKLVSIPEVQKKFDLGYKEVRSFFSELIYQEKLVSKDELYYEYKCDLEEISFIYKQVLWECIQMGEVSFKRLQTKFMLSLPTIKMIVNWMKDNGFVSAPPYYIILMTKNAFIDRFGQINNETDNEEDEEEEMDLESTEDGAFRQMLLKKLLNKEREDLKKRIKECEEKLNSDENDSFDFIAEDDFELDESQNEEANDLSSMVQLCLDELVEKETKFILEDKPDLKKDEFIVIIKDKLELEKKLDMDKVGTYERILEKTIDMKEEDFQDLKHKLLRKPTINKSSKK